MVEEDKKVCPLRLSQGSDAVCTKEKCKLYNVYQEDCNINVIAKDIHTIALAG
jgi:hypothetical protein